MNRLVAPDLLVPLPALALQEVKDLHVVHSVGSQSSHGLEVDLVVHLVEAVA